MRPRGSADGLPTVPLRQTDTSQYARHPFVLLLNQRSGAWRARQPGRAAAEWAHAKGTNVLLEIGFLNERTILTAYRRTLANRAAQFSAPILLSVDFGPQGSAGPRSRRTYARYWSPSRPRIQSAWLPVRPRPPPPKPTSGARCARSHPGSGFFREPKPAQESPAGHRKPRHARAPREGGAFPGGGVGSSVRFFSQQACDGDVRLRRPAVALAEDEGPPPGR